MTDQAAHTATVPTTSSKAQADTNLMIPQPTIPELDYPTPILTLPRGISLRPPTDSDAIQMSTLGNNKAIARNMRTHWPDPYTIEEAHKFITRCRLDKSQWRSPTSSLPPSPPISTSSATSTTSNQNQKVPEPDRNEYNNDPTTLIPSHYAITLTSTNTLIGMIGQIHQTDVHSQTIELGYWIGQPHWNQGIASEVVTAFTQWIFKTYEWVLRIEAKVYGWNGGSGKVLRKAGFELEGRMRASVVRFGVVGDLEVYGLVREGVVGDEVGPICE